MSYVCFFFFQAEDGIRDWSVTGVQTCALPIFARPISAAVGITPSAELKKMTVGETCARSSAIASGMNGTSRYGQPLLLSRKRRRSGRWVGSTLTGAEPYASARHPRLPAPIRHGQATWAT